jgi:hypothetical protein
MLLCYSLTPYKLKDPDAGSNISMEMEMEKRLVSFFVPTSQRHGVIINQRALIVDDCPFQKIQDKEQAQDQDMSGGIPAASADNGDRMLSSEKGKVNNGGKVELNNDKLDNGPSDLESEDRRRRSLNASNGSNLRWTITTSSRNYKAMVKRSIISDSTSFSCLIGNAGDSQCWKRKPRI